MFSLPNPNEVIFLQGEYSTPIVFLSIVIAFFASYTALSMNERIQQNSFFHKYYWLGLASIAMGLGIWSMHFIGMAAFMIPVHMKYDVTITIISVIPSVIASFLAFYFASRTKRSVLSFMLSGIIMGLGISIMHYVGMAAMVMEANYVYKPGLFGLSIGLAMVVSLIAIYIFSTKQRLMKNYIIKSLTALLLGLAVASMHYTGMKAIAFYIPISSNNLIIDHHMNEMNTPLLILGVSIGIFILLFLSVITSILDRYVHYRLNYFDSLTKLPNRRQFEKNYNITSNSRILAVLHIHELDRWNGENGYDFGDEIIQRVGEVMFRLKPLSVGVYRIKGNRFALLTDDARDFERFKVAMRQILSTLSKPLEINDHLLSLKMVCAYSTTDKGSDVNKLFDNTMAVLNHPTIRYENEVIEYDPVIHTYTFERNLLDRIDQAMCNNELYLVYQPKLCLKTYTIIGVEALLRWEHPIHGIISPAVFIPLLEENGKMFRVTDWIIEEVCKQIDEWKSLRKPVLQVAINIPGPYVTSPKLIKTLKNSIEQYNIEGKYIELEMTETSVVKNIESAIQAVNVMREYGFSVALDDFGTGVSSLSYLKRLPITTLKIDKSFIDGIPDSEKDSAIMKAIIALSTSLNLNIVIEGVETKEQIDFLTAMNESLIIQGYYIARPMNAEKLPDWHTDFTIRQDKILL
ncbi:bifunctional diguanylate cyclase/phosphodiesterase [Bacillus sp. Marseille-P3661]|uniref:bifunctional diguanylate cyclase/phosphodiesterase n=1 Tax=Bacillus sp. Marseille-P3661 TaxID=1936234 RepID=UPI000C81FA82|nr:EAL domain-containing protein [Bacillus sp. Marseille-P3661]